MAPAQGEFLALPTELRLEIFDHVLIDNQLELRHKILPCDVSLCFGVHPLAQICGQLRAKFHQHFPENAPKLASHVKLHITDFEILPAFCLAKHVGLAALPQRPGHKLTILLQPPRINMCHVWTGIIIHVIGTLFTPQASEGDPSRQVFWPGAIRPRH